MNHLALPRFWALYRRLPDHVRTLADKNYGLLRANPSHPSLQFKKVGRTKQLCSGRSGSAITTEPSPSRGGRGSSGSIWEVAGDNPRMIRVRTAYEVQPLGPYVRICPHRSVATMPNNISGPQAVSAAGMISKAPRYCASSRPP